MLIRNAQVYDAKNGWNGVKLDILVRDDRIVRIGKNLTASPDGAAIDAKGLAAVPGLVDIHAHLREPGQTHKETIETGTLSAAAGGITTLLTMPNTVPPVDNPETIAALGRRISESARVEVLISSALTKGRNGSEIVDFRANRDAGCAAFTDDGSGIQSVAVMLDLSESAVSTGSLIIEHPELDLFPGRDADRCDRLKKFLKTSCQPEESESLAILIFGCVAGMVGARIHFTHISTRKSLEAIRMLKDVYGKIVTCDCTPHHLALSVEDVADSGDTNFKINPPLRRAEDRQAIEDGLRSGLIDCIATDHAPHAPEEKRRDYSEAPPGTIGFETLLPVTFDRLVAEKKITLLDWVRLVSLEPSRILGLDRGSLSEGAFADIVLFDPAAKVTVTQDNMYSKSKNSVFLGRSYSGRVTRTIFRGRQVFPVQ